MALTPKQVMTEKTIAARRRNGRRSRRVVTTAGQAHAAANLRHGFYSQVQDGVLEALSEDPRKRC